MISPNKKVNDRKNVEKSIVSIPHNLYNNYVFVYNLRIEKKQFVTCLVQLYKSNSLL